MKRKEAIKQIQQEKIQIENDFFPSTKEIKKFLKKAFPDDDYSGKEGYNYEYMKSYEDSMRWTNSREPFENLPIIKLSTITKRKKSKLSQLEKQFSELAKDVAETNKNLAEIRQTLSKDVEVEVEEVEIVPKVVEYWYHSTGSLVLIKDISVVHGGTAKCIHINNEKHFAYHGLDTLKRKATPQEVQTALENEAKKQGYNDKVGIKGLNFGEVWTKSGNIEFKYDEKQNTLQMWSDFAETKSDGWKDKSRAKIDIFKDGIWAEIQQETIKEEEIDWSVPQLLETKSQNGCLYMYNNISYSNLISVTLIDKNMTATYTNQEKALFKKFKGELTIK